MEYECVYECEYVCVWRLVELRATSIGVTDQISLTNKQEHGYSLAKGNNRITQTC